MNTLCIDIGGTSVKLLVVDSDGRPKAERRSVSTPDPATPESVFAAITTEARAAPTYQRASVGFPGVVKSGVSYNAPNLGNALWAQIPIAKVLGEALGVVVRVANDADLQGLGVAQGTGGWNFLDPSAKIADVYLQKHSPNSFLNACDQIFASATQR